MKSPSTPKPDILLEDLDSLKGLLDTHEGEVSVEDLHIRPSEEESDLIAIDPRQQSLFAEVVDEEAIPVLHDVVKPGRPLAEQLPPPAARPIPPPASPRVTGHVPALPPKTQPAPSAPVSKRQLTVEEVEELVENLVEREVAILRVELKREITERVLSELGLPRRPVP